MTRWRTSQFNVPWNEPIRHRSPNYPNLTNNPFCFNVHDPLLGIIFSSFSIYFVRFLDFFDLLPFFRARDKSSINRTEILNYF